MLAMPAMVAKKFNADNAGDGDEKSVMVTKLVMVAKKLYR